MMEVMMYTALDFGVSFMLYIVVGLIIGKVFYKQGLAFQKIMCWSITVGLVVNNVHNNIGWTQLVRLVKIYPMFGLAMIIGMTAMIPVIAIVMIATVKKYNFRKEMKEIKWLI